jgi:hypothetical protein
VACVNLTASHPASEWCDEPKDFRRSIYAPAAPDIALSLFRLWGTALPPVAKRVLRARSGVCRVIDAIRRVLGVADHGANAEFW